ncbi:MAG: sigma-70 family RNA polymerase sigma factor [Acidobacteriota bacterium]|nr:sigma-70 family RNA polymerase sigma factor [Acidobacteriota bacterium]MDH3523636.1 sigma-70 family RNA polymerase sigma factor [Acidobacteriota bacterium]
MAAESPERSDAELVAEALKGREECFGDLVSRYQGPLVNYLYRMVRQPGEAHDLAQDVFIKIYQALDRYDPQYKFSTWLFRIAQNAAIDRIRKRRVSMVSMDRPSDDDEGPWEFAGHDPDPYRDARNRERGDAIQSAIDALPWEYRELIVMRHYGELSYEEIAQAKGMPLGTVKNKLFRGRQMLKESLADFLTD